MENLACNNVIVKNNDIGNFDRIMNIINQAYSMGLVCDIKKDGLQCKTKSNNEKDKIFAG